MRRVSAVKRCRSVAVKSADSHDTLAIPIFRLHNHPSSSLGLSMSSCQCMEKHSVAPRSCALSQRHPRSCTVPGVCAWLLLSPLPLRQASTWRSTRWRASSAPRPATSAMTRCVHSFPWKHRTPMPLLSGAVTSLLDACLRRVISSWPLHRQAAPLDEQHLMTRHDARTLLSGEHSAVQARSHQACRVFCLRLTGGGALAHASRGGAAQTGSTRLHDQPTTFEPRTPRDVLQTATDGA